MSLFLWRSDYNNNNNDIWDSLLATHYNFQWDYQPLERAIIGYIFRVNHRQTSPQYETFVTLLKRTRDLNVNQLFTHGQFPDELNLLMACVVQDDVESVKIMVDQHEGDVHMVTKNSFSVMMYACQYSHDPEMFSLLIDTYKVHIDVRHLLLAINYTNTDAVLALIQHNSFLLVAKHNNQLPLHVALEIKRKHPEQTSIIHLLLNTMSEIEEQSIWNKALTLCMDNKFDEDIFDIILGKTRFITDNETIFSLLRHKPDLFIPLCSQEKILRKTI